jgi:hemerythrin-like metal-binding protein
VALLEWNDELSVGIEMIDKQHKILIRAINLLAMAVKHNSSHSLMSDIFRTLVDYTDTHFAYEEELFDRFGYPETEDHKAKHRALLHKVVDLKARWDAGESQIGPEVLKFLVDWLRNHILGSDKKYSSFLVSALGTK